MKKILVTGGAGFLGYYVVHDLIYAVTSLVDVGIDGHQIFNIGNSQPVEVRAVVDILSDYLVKPAIIETMDLPASDPQITHCDNSLLHEITGFRPQTSIQEGLAKFVEWFKKDWVKQ